MGDFYDLICEAAARLTRLERVGVVVYDRAQGTARAVGSCGVDRDLVRQIEADLDEAPLARRALDEDRVIEAHERLEREIPPHLARAAGLTSLACSPVSAGGLWFGVILADCGGRPFELDGRERQTIHTLGRLAAMAASVERATRHEERAEGLKSRISLVRDVHERVMQRLFGVSLVLGSPGEPAPEELRHCHSELREALGELRSALARPLAPAERETATTLRRMLGRLAERGDAVLHWQEGVELPPELEPLTQSVVVEALRNAGKHASPTRVEIDVGTRGDALTLEVRNDGLAAGEERRSGGAGIGLRLLTLEALQHDGLLEYGPAGEALWRVRLVVPMRESANGREEGEADGHP